MHAIVLAHEKSFNIGPVIVHPSTRSVTRGSRRDILEPRVMQVLVALARAPGEVVSRDDLVEACWAGRIVGDDAVNRVIARLRRTADGIGDGVFAIDTITRVGYRLRLLDDAAIAGIETPETKPKAFRRRELIAGGAIAAGAAATGGGWLLLRNRTSEPRVSPATAALMQQARTALWQNTPEGQNQAIGISRQVTTDNPTYADGWGRLAISYAVTSHWRASAEAAMLQQRARSAAQQALSRDSRNVHALAGMAWAKPYLGNWLKTIGQLRQGLTFDHKDGETNFMLAMILAMTGQNREALKHVNSILADGPTPGVYVWHAQMLWSVGREDELDSLLDEATKLYPTHFGVWFTRFYTAMMGGRPEIALALAANTGERPTGINPEEIDRVVRVAKAIQSRSAPETEAVVKEWIEQAHHGAGYAEIAAQFLSALGQVDEAFTVLRAYYFAEGFDPGEVRFGGAIGSFTAHNDRQTAFLFNPAMASARADPRFAALMNELRFTDYWRASGRNPDYLA